MLGRRNPEAVRELEALQQQERQTAGEASLTTEDFARVLREDFETQQIRKSLETDGFQSVLENAEQHTAIAQQKLEAQMRAWRVDDPSQWSRYETAGIRWGLAQTCSRIEQVYARHNWQLPQLPVVGTLTTGQVSAVTQKTSSGAPIVLIDNGFFRFAAMMSQLTLFAPYDFQNKQYFSEATLQLISDLAATHVCLNTCLYASRRKTPPQYEGLVASYVEAVCMFVLAHEYAHIRAGDLDAHPMSQPATSSDLRSREFEADKLAFITSVEASGDSDHPTSSVFGGFIYFCGLDLLGRADAAYRGARPVTETDPATNDYPTPYERTVNLLNWLETTPYKEHLADPIRTAAAAYNIILLAWDQIMPVFSKMREELSVFDSALHGEPPNPQAAAFALTHGLWLRIQSTLGTGA